MVENVIIMGAAGRDFHNFNVYFRDNKRYNVVCFTATQIPDIDGRQYPPELAGSMYPDGIPIKSDDKLRCCGRGDNSCFTIGTHCFIHVNKIQFIC